MDLIDNYLREALGRLIWPEICNGGGFLVNPYLKMGKIFKLTFNQSD